VYRLLGAECIEPWPRRALHPQGLVCGAETNEGCAAAAQGMESIVAGKILLAGATGFVGSHLYCALEALGASIRCGTRHPEPARKRHGDREWVHLDLDRPLEISSALEGCDTAYYLVHGMAEGEDYDRREAAQARAFRDAAEKVGLSQIVYLGGVTPDAPLSRHLRSRVNVGEILRGGKVPTCELRAGMIIGSGSESWKIVRDLAGRLPVMVLPAWLQNASQPLFIDDLVEALAVAPAHCAREPRRSVAWDVPGPEVITHRELLVRVARHLDRDPWLMEVPLVTPRFSSYWIALVTSASHPVARELVEGLRWDLVSFARSFFEDAKLPRTALDRAIRLTLADERTDESPSIGYQKRIRERLRKRLTLGMSDGARPGR